jgi:hypothetical protein
MLSISLTSTYCISISTDNASVNDVLVATVGRILLTKYGIPESPNLHVRCICHIVNLVVQDILSALGEADDPDNIDYFTLNKDQPLHFDIDTDPDQLELDNEEFSSAADDDDTPDNIVLEEGEKLKATKSLVSKVCHLHCNFFGYITNI